MILSSQEKEMSSPRNVGDMYPIIDFYALLFTRNIKTHPEIKNKYQILWGNIWLIGHFWNKQMQSWMSTIVIVVVIVIIEVVCEQNFWLQFKIENLNVVERLINAT